MGKVAGTLYVSRVFHTCDDSRSRKQRIAVFQRGRKPRGWHIMKSEILREEVVFPVVLWAHASCSRGVKCHRYASLRVDIS